MVNKHARKNKFKPIRLDLHRLRSTPHIAIGIPLICASTVLLLYFGAGIIHLKTSFITNQLNFDKLFGTISSSHENQSDLNKINASAAIISSTPQITETPTLIPTSIPTPTPTPTPLPSPPNQPAISGPVAWTSIHTLTWNHFQGAIPADAKVKAAIFGKIDIKYQKEPTCSVQNNQVTCHLRFDGVTAVAIMDPSISWVKPEFKNEAGLLHEQLHLDLFEVYARKIRAEMQQYIGHTETATASTQEEAIIQANNQLNAILGPPIKRLYDEAVSLQEQYDQETSYSDNPQQDKWTQKIRSML